MMDDVIYRHDAIDAFIEWYGGEPSDIDYFKELLDESPSAQQWIPCSERLPDQNGKYLVVGRQKAINILKFDGGRWYGKWGVVAWMPLPEPYKGEENET